MPCEMTRLGPDSVMIACTRGPRKQPRCACGRESRFQCDAPMPQGGTCDRYVCGRCAVWSRTKADTHYCQEHEGLA